MSPVLIQPSQREFDSGQKSAAAECGRQSSFYAMWHMCVELSHAQVMCLSLLEGSLPLDAHRYQILPLPSAVWLLLRVVSLGQIVSCSLWFGRRDRARESEQKDRREKVRTRKRQRELEKDSSWAFPGQPTMTGTTWSLSSPYLPASRTILCKPVTSSLRPEHLGLTFQQFIYLNVLPMASVCHQGHKKGNNACLPP